MRLGALQGAQEELVKFGGLTMIRSTNLLSDISISDMYGDCVLADHPPIKGPDLPPPNDTLFCNEKYNKNVFKRP